MPDLDPPVLLTGPEYPQIMAQRVSHRAYYEWTFWFFLSSIPYLFEINSIIVDRGRLYLDAFVDHFFFYLIISVFVIIIPSIFYLTFGVLPFYAVRRYLKRSRQNEQIASQNETLGQDTPKTSDPVFRAQGAGEGIDSIDTRIARERVSFYDSHQLLSLYVIGSRRVAQRVRTQASVFLFSGVIIAAVGLGFFYYFNVYVATIDTDIIKSLRVDLPAGRESTDTVPFSISDKILLRVPGIAILFFIEFVALFFLRLFRSSVDEYRYFEEIARARETVLVCLKLAFERGDTSDLKALVETTKLFASVGRLGKDETTDLLESRKLQKDEIVLLEKLIDVFKMREDKAKK